MSSAALFGSITALEYFDVSQKLLPTPDTVTPSVMPSAPAGISEAEVEARIAAASNAVRQEAEMRMQAEWLRREQSMQQAITETVERFAEERSTYFEHVESEVVHLALAIARKILQREAQLDPMLLTGLVRMALDGMQRGPAVRLHVSPDRVTVWQEMQERIGSRRSIEIVADPAIPEDGCLLETEMGTAHLSCETQLKELEQGFLDLLGQRPDRVR